MANNEAGAFLNITPDVLNKLESFDKKLEQIQNHAKTASDALKSGFGNVVVDTSKLENAIISLTNKIGSLNAASASIQNIGSVMSDASQETQQTVKAFNDISSSSRNSNSSLKETDTIIGKIKKRLTELADTLFIDDEGFENLGKSSSSSASYIIHNFNGIQKPLNDIILLLKELKTLTTSMADDPTSNRKLNVLNQFKVQLDSIVSSMKNIGSVKGVEELKTQLTSIVTAINGLSSSSQKGADERLNKLISSINKLCENSIGAKQFTESLNRIVVALTDIGNKISGVQMLERTLNSSAQGAQQASVSISSMAEMLQRIKSPDFSLQMASPEYISSIKESVRQMKAALKFDENGASPLDATIKDAIEKQMALYERQLSDYRSYVNTRNKIERNAATESVRQESNRLNSMSKAMNDWVDKAMTAQARYEDAVRRMNDFRSILPDQKENILGNVMDFSKNAKTIGEITSAIKLLKQTREMLDPEKDKKTLQDINNAIAQHNRALQRAGVQSQNLARHHRNLWDVAGQLKRQLALLFSVSSIEGYIGKIAQVRGEFELTQRSLQAILQNKTKADKIFGQTVELAVKSPFRIKELASYVKQLAAYRIESGKLFDTTKRLADVSAGLGVDMQRLILAYGQVKAAAYLRGTEVRQFTEAGINIYGELQKLFKARDNADYTTAQIVDMISKRKVTFEDVEEIFQNLTNKGGLFFNMQEIQAETLQGKISNLKDSIDIMLNSIGKNKEGVLKGSIDVVKYLIDNWKILAEVLKAVAAAFVVMKINSLRCNEQLILTAIDMRILTDSAQNSLTKLQLLKVGIGKLGMAFKALGSALVSNIGLVAIAALLRGLMEMKSNYDEYNKSLEENTKRYNENMQPINALIAKYNKLSEAAENAKKSQDKNFNIAGNRKEREQAVTQLAEKFRVYNIDKQIGDVTKMSDEQLTNTINTLEKEYRSLTKYIKLFADAYTEVNNRTTWNPANWQDRLEGDSKDLENAASKVNDFSERITQMLDIVGSKYDTLNSELRRYYDSVKNGPDKSKNESETEWIERAYSALVNINRESQVINRLFSAGRFSLFDIKGSIEDLNSQKEEFFREVDRLKIELRAKNLNDPVLISIALDQKAAALKWTDFQQNLARKRLELPFIPELKDEDEDGNGDAFDPKHERDILAERIALIKELNKEYEKLNNVMGSDKATKTVMERYASQLKDVQMPKNIIGDAFLPNKENTAKALQEFSKTISDFRKRIGAQKDANVLFDEMDAENLKEQLDKTKQSIEDMFNGLELHQKLIDAGLSEAEVQALFPGLAKTLDDVERGIHEQYNALRDANGQLGKTEQKDYEDAVKKLNQQRVKESEDLILELTKAYKTQLSEQLQLDSWYYEEKFKIARANLTKEQKEAYNKNLKSQFEKKSDQNSWNAFKKSGSYLNLFAGDLDNMSTKTLDMMKSKLENIKSSLTNLDPSNLKEITDLMKKMEDSVSARSPLMSLIEDFKKIKQLKSEEKTEDELNKTILNNDEQNAKLKEEISLINRIITLKKHSGELSEEDGTFIENNIDLYKKSNEELNRIISERQKEIGINENENDNAYANLRVYAKARAEIELLKKSWGELINQAKSALSSINELVDATGGDSENTGIILAEIGLNIADAVFQAILFSKALEMVKFKAKTALGIIGYILMAIETVASIITSIFRANDKALQKAIEEQEIKIKRLEHAYGKLKETMDNVWDITNIKLYGREIDENIKKQIISLQRMINSENSKKDPDKSKIEDWKIQIEDLKKELLDSENKMIEELGGIGSAENFKSIADDFASAWLDAFIETGDGLSGLEERLDEFMQNYVKQQIMLRLSEQFLKPMFDQFDSIIATRRGMSDNEQNKLFNIEGTISALKDTLSRLPKGFDDARENVLKQIKNLENSEEYKQLKHKFEQSLLPEDINPEAIAGWSEDMKNVFAEYSKAAEEIFNQIGWNPGGKAELSALTQSIQGLTENTAEELAALLNSIRFFVAQQTTDISAIRTMMDARYALESEYSDANPMLVELRAQTGYLEILSDRIDRVFTTNANSRGAGLRVYMQ